MESSFNFEKLLLETNSPKDESDTQSLLGSSLTRNGALVFFKSNKLIDHAQKVLEKSHVKQNAEDGKENKQLRRLRKKLHQEMQLCLKQFEQCHQNKVLINYSNLREKETDRGKIRSPIDEFIKKCLLGQQHLLENCILERNYYDFEKQMNVLTEFFESIDATTRDIKKSGLKFTRVLERPFHEALQSTRHFARETRSISLQSTITKADDQAVRILSQGWLTSQKTLLKALWECLLPWSLVFVKIFNDSSEKILKINMIKFHSTNQRLKQMLDDMKNFNLLDLSFDRINMLSFDLEKSASKIVSYIKLQLVDDKKNEDWLTFSTWLLKWVYVVHQIFQILDKHFLIADIDEVMQTGYFTEWKMIFKKLHSCKESMSTKCFDEISYLSGQLIDQYKCLEKKNLDGIDQKIFSGEFKMNFTRICLQVDHVTNGISKPITALLSSVSSNDAHAYCLLFSHKMERVRTHACLAVSSSTALYSQVHDVILCTEEIDDITKDLLSLSNGRDSLTKNHMVLLLKYKWLVQLHHLLFILRKIPDVKFNAISAIMRHLYTEKDVSTPYEFIDVLSEKQQTDVTCGRTSILDSEYIFSTSDSVFSSHPNSYFSTEFEYEDGYEDEVENNVNENMKKSRKLPTIQQDDLNNSALESTSANNYHDVVTSSSHSQENAPALLLTLDSDNDDVIPSQLDASSYHDSSSVKTISAAARVLHDEADQWDDSNNQVVSIVKSIANHMFRMGQFAEGNTDTMTTQQFVDAAKEISSNAKSVVKFAKVISSCINDASCRSDLLHHSELVQTISTQLRIVASVKSFHHVDNTTKTMLIANASNLMRAIVGTLKAAEAASIKIHEADVESDRRNSVEHSQNLILQWKRKTRLSRAMNALTSPRDDLGLRKSAEPPSTFDNIFLTSNISPNTC